MEQIIQSHKRGSRTLKRNGHHRLRAQWLAHLIRWGPHPTVTEQKPSLQRNSAVFANAWSMPVQRLAAAPLEGLESWPKPRRTGTVQLRNAANLALPPSLASLRGFQSLPKPTLARCSSPGDSGEVRSLCRHFEPSSVEVVEACKVHVADEHVRPDARSCFVACSGCN